MNDCLAGRLISKSFYYWAPVSWAPEISGLFPSGIPGNENAIIPGEKRI